MIPGRASDKLGLAEVISSPTGLLARLGRTVETIFSLGQSKLLIMAMIAKCRDLLAMLLVFAVSPLSMCTPTVCSITCSFHEAAVRGSRLIGPDPKEAVIGSVKHPAGMHCHGPANTDGPHSAAFRDHQGPCHKEKCLSPQVVVRPALVQAKYADPTQAIKIEPSAAISLATPSFAAGHLSRSSRTRLPDVFGVSGILRI